MTVAGMDVDLSKMLIRSINTVTQCDDLHM